MFPDVMVSIRPFDGFCIGSSPVETTNFNIKIYVFG